VQCGFKLKTSCFQEKRGFFVWNFSLPPLNYHYPWFFFSSNLIFFCTSTPAIIHSEDGNLYSPFFSAPARSPALFVVCFYFFVCFYFSLSLNIYFEKNIAAKYVSVYCAHPKKKKLPILLKEKELNDTFKKQTKHCT